MEEAVSKPKKIPSTPIKFEKMLKEVLGKSFDMVISRFATVQEEAVVAFLDGMTNKDLIDRDVIKPLRAKDFCGDINLALNIVFETETSFEKILTHILDGNVVMYYLKTVYVIDLKQFDKRAVETPHGEEVTRGPKEGFTESILTNVTMLRRKLKTTNLIYEKLVIGKQSNTIVAIAYLDNIVNREVLDKVRRKLEAINTDAILESGYLEQYIEENPLSVVSGIGLTQKPDVAAARILEGRVAVFCDGTPHILTIPELFIETIHTPEEHYNRTIQANFTRALKLFALGLSVLLPGLSVSIITFNQELLPFTFLISFVQSTMGTPLPAAAELFFLALMFELLKEAGLRMPKVIGSSITIVGALILGETAVRAGIVGAPSVIIIAISSVASLATTNLNEFSTLYSFFFLFLGSVMGIIGIVTGMTIMLTQLISKESFGIPILSSFSKEEMKDSFFRFPLKTLKFRPQSVVKNNIVRNDFGTDNGGEQ